MAGGASQGPGTDVRAPLTVYIDTFKTKVPLSDGSGNLIANQLLPATDNLTALSGGGQTGATPLPSMLNRVVTVAAAADSVLLPASVAGMEITVVNANATHAVAVFPNGATDVINALSVQTAFSVAATKVCTFYCVTAGQWHTLLSA